MKLLLILAASLVLNIGLAVAYCRKAAPVVASTEFGHEAIPSPNPSQRLVEKVVTNVVTVTKPAAPFDWRTVESDDYKQYIANLRAIGCPEKTLHDIIMADVNDLYRQRAGASKTNRFEYWKPGLLGNAFDEQHVAQQQEQLKERRDLLGTLLGGSYSDQADPTGGQLFSPMEQMTGDFLGPDKQSAMKALEVKYAGRMLKAAKESGRGRRPGHEKRSGRQRRRDARCALSRGEVRV